MIKLKSTRGMIHYADYLDRFELRPWATNAKTLCGRYIKGNPVDDKTPCTCKRCMKIYAEIFASQFHSISLGERGDT